MPYIRELLFYLMCIKYVFVWGSVWLCGYDSVLVNRKSPVRALLHL